MEFIIRNGLNVRLNVVGDVDKYLQEDNIAKQVKVIGRGANMKSVSAKGQVKSPISFSRVSKKSRKERRLENRIKMKVIDAQIKAVDKLDQKLLDLSVLEASYKRALERLKEKQAASLGADDFDTLASLRLMEEQLKDLHEKLSAGYSECIPDVSTWVEESGDENVVDILRELEVNKGDKDN